MTPTLLTQRLALRAWRATDIDAYQAMAADPAVMTYIGDGQPRTADDAAASFDRMTDRWRKHGFGVFAVELLEQETVIGLCGLEPLDPAVQSAIGGDDGLDIEGTVEIGWRLDREHWGHGYATEAAEAVVDWSFSADSALELARLLAIVQVKNNSSIAVAERLGMRRCQRTIVPGQQRWIDVFELVRSTP